MIALMFVGISHADDDDEDYIVGKIVELLKSENVIQVKDRHYKVEMVLVDFGGEPVMGSMTELEQGSPVKIYVNGRAGGYWVAEKVIIFAGKKRESILKEMGE
jgi:hypothetical protein